MVLRNPYAFLIKHFRLIHLFITAIFTYIVIKNQAIYKYLREVIKDSVNKYNYLNYVNYSIYIWIIIAIILCFAVYYLLKYKDKPRKIYIFTIIGYIIVGTFTSILYSYISEFSNIVIDQKTIRLYTDILLITLFFQYIIIAIMLIRGLGFDIKKFNFNKDAIELNLNASDSEEIEVNTQIDTTNVMRVVRKNGRELSYFYKEFKIYILVIIVILLIFLGIRFYNYASAKYAIYNENDKLGTVNIVTIKDSYYINKDNHNYIVVNFDIFRNGTREQFNINNLELLINNNKYLPNKNICNTFNKYGICYKKQYITRDEKNYIAVYEIEGNIKNKNYILYKEFYESTYKVKLNIKKP